MFIICKNDFPYKACPVGTSRDCAEGIAQRYQDARGMQIGLADKTYFHVQEVSLEAGEFCEWEYDEDDHVEFWTTACGEAYCLYAGGLRDNRTKFCPYCGRKIKELKQETENEN